MNIPQTATIRINCKGALGTGVLYFPGPDLEYVYIFTAKHCLAGKEFNLSYTNDDIKLEKIFNPTSKTYHTYQVTSTDIILISDDNHDIALIIIAKNQLIQLTDAACYYQTVDTTFSKSYQTRGFAGYTEQEFDRPFDLEYVEDQKNDSNQFLLRFHANLDTFISRAVENLEGLSGAGVFTTINGITYLSGIMHTYEDGNIFAATKISVYNDLIAATSYSPIPAVKPETDTTVLATYKKMEANRKAIGQRTQQTVGGIHIPREFTIPQTMLNTTGIAVIFGKPGVGKSAIADALISKLQSSPGLTVISFTAEQLYCETLQEALSNAGYTTDLESILSSSLAGNRIVIWIESFEKLIESGFNGAFKELLGYITSKSHLHLLVTIRDYLLQKFKINYRFELPTGNFYYRLDAFSDQEMDTVREKLPSFIPLLYNSKLHDLLRTPYYLDKAIRILPELLKEEELDEISFKRLMWEYIVEAGDKERGVIFMKISLKRARKTSLYTTIDAPILIITALLRDNILKEENSEMGNRYCPSHDILEDWALVRDIKQRKQAAETPVHFIIELDDSPALTRAFRLWLDEVYRNSPIQSATFVQQILLEPQISPKYREVLLIASLRSAHANILFDSMHTQLLDDEGKLLRYVIRLLQTGCKTFSQREQNFDHLVPIGSGWDYMIKFIRQNHSTLLSFSGFEFIILELIESWSLQLPDFNPVQLPPGSADAAFMLEDFIYRNQQVLVTESYGKWDNSDLRKYITTLLKLTGSSIDLIKPLMAAVVNIHIPHPRWSNKKLLKRVRHYALEGIISDQLCKYFPDEVIAIAGADWPAKEETPHPGSLRSMMHVEINIGDFNFDEDLEYMLDFSSGYQSFFYWMFLYHSDKALSFVIPLLNNAFEYNKKAKSTFREDHPNIIIPFPEGITREYIYQEEYWIMYRGINTRSKLVSSLLMALEKGLLDLADLGEQQFNNVRLYLDRIIDETNNVAMLGIISSLIQAHPELLSKKTVSMLGIKEIFMMDSIRCNYDMSSMGNYNTIPLLLQERIQEDKRQHRLKYYLGLIGFVANYMFQYRTHNQQLFKLVDYMWDSLDSEDIKWRKFLHDMDLRKYKIQEVVISGNENVLQILPNYDETVEKLRNSRDQNDKMPAANFSWAKNVFEEKEIANKTYEIWKTGYDYLQKEHGEHTILLTPGTLAAIGLRDFADKLSSHELDWCQQVLFGYGKSYLSTKQSLDNLFMAIDKKEALYGLSFILKTHTDKNIQKETKKLIFNLLVTPFEDQAKSFLTTGLSENLWNSHNDFLQNCWYGMLQYYNQSKEDPKWMEELLNTVVDGTINPINDTTISENTSNDWLLNDTLRILPINTSDPQHHTYFDHMLNFLTDKLNNKSRYNDYLISCRYVFKVVYTRHLLSQPLSISEKLFINLLNLMFPKNIEDNTPELHKFLYEQLEQIILTVNSDTKDNFWALWERLRLYILDHSRAYLITLFMLRIDWQKDIREWYILEGKILYYKDFILQYGHNNINASLKLLTGIAFRNFMPDSITWIKSLLYTKEGADTEISLIDQFIQDAFYNYGSDIKNNREYLTAFIDILEIQIAKGSSKAFMLRDELSQY